MAKSKAKAQVKGHIRGVKPQPLSFKEALELDLQCLGKEPSDEELIKDEQRRERAFQKTRCELRVKR